MKKFILFLSLVLAMPFNAMANEKSGFYLTPKVIGGIQGGSVGLYEERLGEDGNTQFNNGVFGGALALGYNFKKYNVPMRMELELSTFTSASKEVTYDFSDDIPSLSLSIKGKNGITAMFANLYYDFETSSAFTPYIGGGLGVAWNRLSVDDIVVSDGSISISAPGLPSKTKAQFAWNIGLGCSYAFSDTWSLDLGYRYAQFGKGETQTVTNYVDSGMNIYAKSKKPTSMHQFLLGVRVSF